MDPVASPRAPDALRRCFICLTDQDASEPSDSWVDPCPCTLEAHQDCMLSWVTDCERSNRPLQCPVCKSKIEMEGMRDPIVALHDIVSKRFTKMSPLVLCTAFSIGVQFSMQMYGALALWAFSGRETMMRFVMGPGMVIDGRHTAPLAFARERIANALVLMNVAPALLFGHMFPSWSSKIFLPAASFYGMYHVTRDEQFFSWPPSPQLAMAVFPYIRSVYYNLYKELVLPYEARLNRQLLGLPPVEPRPVTQAENENQGGQGRNDRNAGRNAARAQGGVLGILQTLIDALEQDDDANNQGADGQQVGQIEIDIRADEENQPDEDEDDEEDDEEGIVLEVIVEEVEMNEEGDAGEAFGDHENQAVPGADAVPAPEPEVPADAEPAEQEQNHEAPQAPARRLSLGTILSNMSNAIVSALIIPGVSFAAGEALRLVLPKEWTTMPRRSSWLRAGAGGRPGLFQQQWGRSLVGGCLYIVLRDVLRVYTKTRKVAAMTNRRVKNVDRPRRGKK